MRSPQLAMQILHCKNLHTKCEIQQSLWRPSNDWASIRREDGDSINYTGEIHFNKKIVPNS